MKNIILILIFCTMALSVSAIDKPTDATGQKVDSLFIIASSGMIKYREMVAPAIDSLAALGAPAVPRLVEHYDTKSARERHTINDILVKIGSPAVAHLIERLKDSESEKKSRICYTLGNIKDSSATNALIAEALDHDWRVRSSIAGAFGKINDIRAEQVILTLLSDSVETVRKSAVVAAGKMSLESAIPLLVGLLGDPFYGTRMTASEALINFGEKAIDPIADSLDSENELLGNLGCTTLGHIGGDHAAFTAATQINSENPIRRSLVVEAILLSESSLACGFVEILAEEETDHLVMFYINQVLQSYAER